MEKQFSREPQCVKKQTTIVFGMARYPSLARLVRLPLFVLCLIVSTALLCRGADANTNLPPYSILVRAESKPVELGGTIRIGIYSPFAQEITNGLAKDANTTKNGLVLYLNGVRMTGLTPDILPTEAFGTPSNNYANPTLVLQYALERDANNKDSRIAWDTLLGRIGWGQQFVEVGVGLNNGIPHLAPNEPKKTVPLQFWVRPPWFVWSVIIIGVFVFFLLMRWVQSTHMLREAGPGTAYSLGKTQMAFWGLLVALSFFGVWIVSQKMERIPPQVLVLLGISATTGLSSVLIGSSKRNMASVETEKSEGQRDLLEKKQAELEVKKAALQSDKFAGNANWNNDKEVLLANINSDLNSNAAELAKIGKAIADHTNNSKAAPSENSWWKDIISDENGMSFHRFQVVLWTIILGIVFLCSVASTFSMPEFESTLLILMGISNGTYLGFKTKET